MIVRLQSALHLIQLSKNLLAREDLEVARLVARGCRGEVTKLDPNLTLTQVSIEHPIRIWQCFRKTVSVWDTVGLGHCWFGTLCLCTVAQLGS